MVVAFGTTQPIPTKTTASLLRRNHRAILPRKSATCPGKRLLIGFSGQNRQQVFFSRNKKQGRRTYKVFFIKYLR
jgi:hypothetical protein